MKEIILRFILMLSAAAALIAVCIAFLEREDVNYSDSFIIDETVINIITEAQTDNGAVQAAVVLDNITVLPETKLPDNTEETEVTSSSRTIITSRVRKDYDSNAVYIDMVNNLQLPELPVGCEITALTTLLNFYGFKAEKTALAENYLPIGTNYRTEGDKVYKDSFFDFFIGDPFSRGYGCFANAIEKAAEGYIADNGGGYTVLNISGAHPDILYDYLIQGVPVLCWATDGMIEPEYYETWYDFTTGEQLDWYLNEHCFVLAGFNISGNTVTLNDPMKGIIDYNIDKFETRYDQMHRQAVVILEDTPQEKRELNNENEE